MYVIIPPLFAHHLTVMERHVMQVFTEKGFDSVACLDLCNHHHETDMAVQASGCLH